MTLTTNSGSSSTMVDTISWVTYPAVHSHLPKYFKESDAHYRDEGTIRLFYFFTDELITIIALTESISMLLTSFAVHLENTSLKAFVPAYVAMKGIASTQE